MKEAPFPHLGVAIDSVQRCEVAVVCDHARVLAVGGTAATAKLAQKASVVVVVAAVAAASRSAPRGAAAAVGPVGAGAAFEPL